MRYSDPTGHMRVEEAGSSKGSLNCSKYPQYCNSGKKKSKQELNAMHPIHQKHEDEGSQLPWLTDFAGHGRLESWDGRVEIDPVEWENLLKVVGDDVQLFSTGWYDTPFFNDYTRSGIGCFNGGQDCYDRSELNYIGEGEALAALGLSRDATQNIVWAWKNKGPLVLGLGGLDSTPRRVSQGTIDMTNIGWNYYHEHYSETSLSLRSLAMPPVITPALLLP
jgi:hypothetical protein